MSRIPRDEVEEMGRAVMHELNELEPGCVSTIVGGYVSSLQSWPVLCCRRNIDIEEASRRATTSTLSLRTLTPRR